ncbi:DUF3303 family protein [Streptomyces sp. NPDC008313]|uniref:DUF3303 family protein n=1 Tax=Streptomyces sp. NPDC008313 TaxID=3364826 RepID=UPI0036EE72BF
MRVMLKATMNTDKTNEVIESGKLPKIVQDTMEQIKPEAAYFGAHNGRRTCYMVFDMQDSSQMPSIAEPFFSQMGAEVEFLPVMNPEDLQKGLANLR